MLRTPLYNFGKEFTVSSDQENIFCACHHCLIKTNLSLFGNHMALHFLRQALMNYANVGQGIKWGMHFLYLS